MQAGRFFTGQRGSLVGVTGSSGHPHSVHQEKEFAVMTRPFETLVTLLMCLLGVVAYWVATKIGGMSFDPLGPKAVPEGLSLLLVVLCLLLGVLRVRTFWRERSGKGIAEKAAPSLDGDDGSEDATDDQAEGDAKALSLWTSLLMMVLAVAFVVGIFLARLPVSLVVWAYVCLAGLVMSRQNLVRRLIILLIVGLILGVGCEWIFTRFFFVDLPTLW